ncbi:VOC family protein [Pedobacter caeni]|uniref:VOC domain-containing protein n=1 Tax=Pedobacter caeni TaxID=288992 RepID=A0A1M5G3N9_9SPHI|nr:VOC family protein [Pedobacter caeni]SHF98420.1 hypothetical protein SAMN04488522_10445 [Pedobacter caeni]
MKLNFETLIIFVQDIDKLKPFYVDVLKLEIMEEFKSEWLLLGSGNCKIGLHKIGDQYLEEGAAPFKFDNNTKVVFEIDEDIHRVRTTLLSEGVSMKEVTTFEGYDYLLCDGEDPEGNVFQIKQRKPRTVISNPS